MKSLGNIQRSTLIHSFQQALAACGLLLLFSAAQAATLTVTNLDDSGPGSLRQAIADAAPGDTIDFATNVTGTITLTSGELVVTNDLTISGPGATNLTVSGNFTSRVLLTTNGSIAISGVTIANGYLPPNDDYLDPNFRGAGIYNATTLVISNCVVSGNTNLARNFGGGICNIGALTVIRSTIAKNHAVWGGGIQNDPTVGGSGTLKLIGSAVVQNTASQGGGISGGGICAVTNATVSENSASFLIGGIFQSAALYLHNSTVCSNHSPTTAPYPAGIWLTDGGTAVVANSIIAGNGEPTFDFRGPLVSHDFNLIGDTNGVTITGVTTHNIYGQDPLLGPLADNGGPTPTHALLPGSPAIDHGSSGGLATDQRGQPRPFNFPAYFDADDASDIGAYELQERAQTGPGFTVNTTDDADDGVPGIAHCSLREAIAAANANADTNTIDFAAEVPGLHTGVTGTITLTNGQLTITNSVNINGPGAGNLTVSGNDSNRVFLITNSTVALSQMCIANGNAGNSTGGGIRINRGQVTVTRCSLVGNRASEGGAIAGAISPWTINLIGSMIYSNHATSTGGGVYNPGGDLNVLTSSIFANQAGSFGGGINNGGNLTLRNCTVSQNSVISGGGEGGGIAAQTLNIIVSSTICSNSAPGAGGGIYLLGSDSSDQAVILNSIIAGNSASSGPDCYSAPKPFNSLDYNLIQNTNGCTITNLTAHNIYNQDPKLGPLADLGGPTPTHALRFDSPALDAGHSGGLTTDQRGLPRPIDDPTTPNAEGGDGSDIGAYEADPNLRITSIEKLGDDIRLRFNTVLGRTYGVDSENNLDGSWSTLTNNIPGDGSSVQAVDTGTANVPRRFYRAVLLP
ncbi:MAG: CSLREA domain-containing protein [Verrucomicrobia bacterium]|nr:CSLREA domain-containing protein [Verrucomicrobiota bacterium]